MWYLRWTVIVSEHKRDYNYFNDFLSFCYRFVQVELSTEQT